MEHYYFSVKVVLVLVVIGLLLYNIHYQLRFSSDVIKLVTKFEKDPNYELFLLEVGGHDLTNVEFFGDKLTGFECFIYHSDGTISSTEGVKPKNIMESFSLAHKNYLVKVNGDSNEK